jgi:transposase
LSSVVIAVDPHKVLWIAVALTADFAAAGTLRVLADRAGYRELRRFAARWPRVWWVTDGVVGWGHR